MIIKEMVTSDLADDPEEAMEAGKGKNGKWDAERDREREQLLGYSLLISSHQNILTHVAEIAPSF